MGTAEREEEMASEEELEISDDKREFKVGLESHQNRWNSDNWMDSTDISLKI